MRKIAWIVASLFIIPIYASEAAPAAQPNSLPHTLMLLALGILFFYFILWRPEQKRRKKLEAQRSSLKKGDRVIILGGIIATVAQIEKSSITLKLVDGSKMEILPTAISEVQNLLPESSITEAASDKPTCS